MGQKQTPMCFLSAGCAVVFKVLICHQAVKKYQLKLTLSTLITLSNGFLWLIKRSRGLLPKVLQCHLTGLLEPQASSILLYSLGAMKLWSSVDNRCKRNSVLKNMVM